MSSVTDRNGLVKDGGYLVVFNPVVQSGKDPVNSSISIRYNKAMVFKVLARQNVQGEKYVCDLPTTTSTSFRSYDGSTATASAAGCLPARAYTAATGLQFGMAGVENTADMWDLDHTYYDRLFHVQMRVSPSFVRVGVDMPTGTNQARFQRTKKSIGIGSDFGWRYGYTEFVPFPEVDCSYQFGNTTNVELMPKCEFLYGEYIIGIPSDPDIVFKVLTGKEPSHRVTMPISIYDAAISQGLIRTYGTDGFRIFPNTQYSAAIDEYQAVITSECESRVLV